MLPRRKKLATPGGRGVRWDMKGDLGQAGGGTGLLLRLLFCLLGARTLREVLRHVLVQLP